MSIRLRIVAALFALGAFWTGWAQAQTAKSRVYAVSANEAPRLVSEAEKQRAKSALLTQDVTAGGVVFHVTYSDPEGIGFQDGSAGEARRAALEETLVYVGTFIGMTGTLELDVHLSQVDGDGALATCGTYFDSLLPKFTSGAAYERLLTGTKPYYLGNLPELYLTVDFGYPFYTGPEQGLPSNKYDLRTILLHELTHGLGFLTLMGENGQTILPGVDAILGGVYTILDGQVRVKGNSTPLLTSYLPEFQGNALDLIGGELVFVGSAARSAYGHSDGPPLYAPQVFVRGVSIQHWDREQMSELAVMAHQFYTGESIREYTEVDAGALHDIGYLSAEGTGGSSAEGDIGDMANLILQGCMNNGMDIGMTKEASAAQMVQVLLPALVLAALGRKPRK